MSGHRDPLIARARGGPHGAQTAASRQQLVDVILGEYLEKLPQVVNLATFEFVSGIPRRRLLSMIRNGEMEAHFANHKWRVPVHSNQHLLSQRSIRIPARFSDPFHRRASYRQVTVRLSPEQAATVEALTLETNRSAGEVIADAIDHYDSCGDASRASQS